MHDESERAVQERIEATRERMGHTIERIGDRVNPDRVQRELKNRAREQVDELKTNVKRKARSTMRDVEHGVSEKGRGLWATIKDNPIPAGMIGVGAAWLMANGSGRSDSPRYGGDMYGAAPSGYATADTPGAYSSGYTGAISEPGTIGDLDEDESRLDEVKSKASETADNVRVKGERAMHSARDKGSEMAHRASEGMHEVGDRARDLADEAQYRARRAEHRIEDSVRENPMAAGAVAAALGFAAGMMIPETRKEHEMMGRTRDRLLDRAQDTARRAGHKAKETARETAGQTAKRAVDEVWAEDGQTGQDSVSEPTR